MGSFQKLHTKITLTVFIILGITVGTVSLFSVHNFKREYTKVLVDEVDVIGSVLQSQLNRIMLLGIPLDELVGFDVQCREIVEKYSDVKLALVTDSEGLILFHSNAAMKEQVLEERLLQAVRSGRQQSITFGIGEERYLGAVIPVSEPAGTRLVGAVVVGAAYESIMLRSSALVEYPVLITVLMFIAAFFLLMTLLSRWVTVPLGALSKHMREVASGNWRTNIRLESKDEIGELGQTFNDMVLHINGLMEESGRHIELETRYKAEQEQRRQSELIRNLFIRLSTAYEIDGLKKEVMNGLLQLVPLRMAAIWLETEGMLEWRGGIDGKELSDNRDYMPRTSELDRIFTLLRGGMLYLSEPDRGMDRLALPIVINNRVSGMLLLWNREPYTRKNIDLAVVFTSQIGVFIQNTRMYHQLRRMATTDPLTGVPSRGHFYETAMAEFARHTAEGKDIGIMMFDVDHFKQINDTFGHPFGDKVLSAVAACVSSQLEPGSEMLGRYGGEEFAVLLPGADSRQLWEKAERIRQEVQSLLISSPDGALTGVRISLGAASWKPGIGNVDELLKLADDALYEAKNSGRNRTVMSV